MSDASRTGPTPGDPPAGAGGTRTDLAPDDDNIFGPDAPNTRADDPPGGQVAPEATPPEPPSIPLDHGDFAPDET